MNERPEDGRRWAEVAGFTAYAVSDRGEIWSYSKGLVMRPCPDRRGYCRQPMVSDEGKKVTKYVHILVAEAFVARPEEPGEYEVDHDDGNQLNNCAWNLKWVTHAVNMERAFARKGNWLAAAPRRRVAVVMVDEASGERVEYGSIKEAAGALSEMSLEAGGPAITVRSGSANICRACGSGGMAYGFRWERA